MKNLYSKREVVTSGGKLQKNLKWEGAASKKSSGVGAVKISIETMNNEWQLMSLTEFCD